MLYFEGRGELFMWADHSFIYHLFPLGFCKTETVNDRVSVPRNRIGKIIDWLPHFQNLGVDTLLLGPIWEASAHGYDTADFFWLDRRLGSNDDFKKVAAKIHEAGMKLVLDGVFNHVGRDFWAFRDVCENKENSRCKDWFTLNFDFNNSFNDGFCYCAWEGCEDLVTLNLANPEVRKHLLDAVRFWIEEFGVDGLRLDVAYCLDPDFIRELHQMTQSLKPDFWLMGEVVKGNYRRWLKPGMLDSVTNYECWKGLWSSCNSHNMYEIAYSLNRQFGAEGLYQGVHLYNFADNHDVSRLASKLKDSRHLPLVYTMLFTMPGIPSLYYGSEWAVGGRKRDGDKGLRCCLELQEDTPLSVLITRLAELRRKYSVFADGNYEQLAIANEFLSFSRDNMTVIVNIGETSAEADAGDRRYSVGPYAAAVFDETGNRVFSTEE